MSTGTAITVRDENTALAAPRAMRLLRPIAEPAAVIEAQNAARDMVHKALVPGRDFGVVPGTGDKPSMLKPGAERVALAFGCYYGTPELIDREVDHDREVRWIKRKKQWNNKFRGDKTFVWVEESGVSLGLYRYVVRVPVIERATGDVVGSGIGSCSSMESKYIDRPRDSENTILKMAYKRAMVAACLVTFGLSDEFTQDVEDMAHFGGEDRGGAPADDDAAAAERAPNSANEPEAKCPTCGGGMWDNRTSKTNPKSPDFKCRDRVCEGVYWPGQWPPAPGATDEQKARILALLQTADLNDQAKQKTVDEVNSADRPLGAKRACAIIDRLEKLAQPDDPSQEEMPLAAPPIAGSGAPPENPTTLKPGKIEDALEKPEGEQRAHPSPAGSPASKSGAKRATEPAANGDAAQLRGLAQRAVQLMKHAKLTESADERAVFRKRFDAAETVEAMAKLVTDLDRFIDLPF